MKKLLFSALFLLLALGFAQAQAVSINTDSSNPDPSAILDVKSTDKGVLVPRMTTAQRTAIATPATGLLVFDTSTGGFWFYNGTAWTDLSAGGSSYAAGPGISIDAGTISNTGDIDAADDITTGSTAGGDLAGTYPDPTVARLQGVAVKDTTPATGQILRYDGSQWKPGNATLLADDDNDTNVQVEKNADEDIIRFDLGGTEKMVLQQNANGTARLELPDIANTTSIGLAAGYNNMPVAGTSGNDNTFLGYFAGFANTTGSYNTFLGSQAGFNSMTGSSNTAVGHLTLYANSTGFFNTAVGRWALRNNTTGAYNTAVGSNTLYTNTTGIYNTAIGHQTLYLNTTGNFNTALGASALRNNTTGISNVATGHFALFFNTTGNYSTANGYRSLYTNTTGAYNTATGYNTQYSNTTGSNNTAFGYAALYANAIGNSNTAIGYAADVATDNLNNATAIGSGAIVNADNKVRIGDASVTVIEGQVDWTFPSDARFKYNVRDAGIPGLAFIEKLRPVTYQFDTRKFDEHLLQNMPDSIRQRRMGNQAQSKSNARVQTGFLAQEVEQVCKDLDFEFSGLHIPAGATDNYGLSYGSFVPLLVKGMQEQQVLIDALQAENIALKARLDTQSALLRQITAALQTAGITIQNP